MGGDQSRTLLLFSLLCFFFPREGDTCNKGHTDASLIYADLLPLIVTPNQIHESQDKFNIMKGKLEKEDEITTSERDSSTSRQLSDIDASLARLQRKLREGSALETGQRGANKVYN